MPVRAWRGREAGWRGLVVLVRTELVVVGNASDGTRGGRKVPRSFLPCPCMHTHGCAIPHPHHYRYYYCSQADPHTRLCDGFVCLTLYAHYSYRFIFILTITDKMFIPQRD
jgi:hypothetical protein